MTITRKCLYRAGLPLGDAVTRTEHGRIIYGGGGDSSSSAATTTQTTDKRQVIDGGAIGITADGSTVNVQNTTLDAGIVKAAMDAVSKNNATIGQGINSLIAAASLNDEKNAGSFELVLGLADKLFSTGASLLKTSSDTTMAQVGALTNAQSDSKGAIDQKTIVIMVVAGAVVATAIYGSK